MTTQPQSYSAPRSVTCSAAAFADLCREILGAGKSLRFQARGASMWPLVRDGDVLLVRPFGSVSVRLGDLVLFRKETGDAVVHRVIRVEAGPQGRRYTVQGDALVQPDGLIPEAQVYGRVAAIDRAGVHIDIDRPVMRVLSWCAVLRSRGNLGRGKRSRLARQLVKRLPVLSRYLA